MFRTLMISLAAFLLFSGVACAQSDRAESLYTTYCDSCHTEQVHWRENKIATDWTSLLSEVRRWQANSKLDWPTEDIESVADYLNTLHYHYPTSEK